MRMASDHLAFSQAALNTPGRLNCLTHADVDQPVRDPRQTRRRVGTRVGQCVQMVR
jgi:hypothetical protein